MSGVPDRLASSRKSCAAAGATRQQSTAADAKRRIASLVLEAVNSHRPSP